MPVFNVTHKQMNERMHRLERIELRIINNKINKTSKHGHSVALPPHRVTQCITQANYHHLGDCSWVTLPGYI